MENSIEALTGFDFSLETLATDPAGIHIMSFFGAIILTYLSLHSITAFINRGWWAKRDDVLSSLSKEAKRLYLYTFLQTSADDPSDAFGKLYRNRYGTYRLIIPTVLLVLTTFPSMFLITQTGLGHILIVVGNKATPLGYLADNQRQLTELPGAAAAAISGAYLWIVLAFVSAAARANLPPGTVLAGAVRMAISAPLGYAIASIAPKGFGLFLAFAIGAFPLEQVQVLLRQIANKSLGLELGTTDEKDQVTSLDGVDRPTADRLSQADISTVSQFAYCDPVQVSMKTNINFDAIVDGQNQALLRLYFDIDTWKKLRSMGLRGAMEVKNLIDDKRNPDPDYSGPANATFVAVANAIPIDQAGLARALDEIGNDPYTIFLSKVWGNDKELAAVTLTGASLR